MTTKKVTDI